MIVIFGPTASGKTALSLAIATHLPVEIINMDIGSFYAPFTIGTAKPDWRSSTTVHHLFDSIDIPINYTVAHYRTDVIQLIQEIKKRGNIPLLVGGSGFYLKGLLFPVQGVSDQKVRTYTESTQQLWNTLFDIDPNRAQQINKNDRYRIERALTIWHESAQLPSKQVPVFDPVDAAFIIHVTRDRDDLYDRINKRVVATNCRSSMRQNVSCRFA